MTARALVVAIVALAVVAGGAAAAARAPKPVLGAWKVVDLFDMTNGGKFTVTKTMRVRGIRATPGTGASTGCGTDEVVVKGTFRMRTATRGGFTSWIVGRAAPRTSDGVATVAAKVTQGGETHDGRVKLIFAYDNRRRASGAIEYAGCTLEFDARRG